MDVRFDVTHSGENSCRPFGIAEHIQNPVIANSVAAAEVFMRIVVKHTPPESAASILGSEYVVQHLGITQRMREPVRRIVKTLGREHMPVVLGYKIRDVFTAYVIAVACACSVKVVIRINVFEQMRIANISYSACLTGRIQFAREFIGNCVKSVGVERLVNAHAPQDN